MESKGFYMFNLPQQQSRRSMFLLLFLMLCVVMLIMFPLWPYTVKYGIWFVTFYLSLFMVITIVAITVYTTER